MNAPEIIKDGLATVAQRGVDYDKPQGERSMAATVAMFNLHTGHNLSVQEGWKFMIFLKLERAKANPRKGDTYVDLVGYAGLLGEEGLSNPRPGPDYVWSVDGWIPAGDPGPRGEQGTPGPQ